LALHVLRALETAAPTVSELQSLLILLARLPRVALAPELLAPLHGAPLDPWAADLAAARALPRASVPADSLAAFRAATSADAVSAGALGKQQQQMRPLDLSPSNLAALQQPVVAELLWFSGVAAAALDTLPLALLYSSEWGHAAAATVRRLLALAEPAAPLPALLLLLLPELFAALVRAGEYELVLTLATRQLTAAYAPTTATVRSTAVAHTARAASLPVPVAALEVALLAALSQPSLPQSSTPVAAFFAALALPAHARALAAHLSPAGSAADADSADIAAAAAALEEAAGGDPVLMLALRSPELGALLAARLHAHAQVQVRAQAQAQKQKQKQKQKLKLKPPPQPLIVPLPPSLSLSPKRTALRVYASLVARHALPHWAPGDGPRKLLIPPRPVLVAPAVAPSSTPAASVSVAASADASALPPASAPGSAPGPAALPRRYLELPAAAPARVLLSPGRGHGFYVAGLLYSLAQVRAAADALLLPRPFAAAADSAAVAATVPAVKPTAAGLRSEYVDVVAVHTVAVWKQRLADLLAEHVAYVRHVTIAGRTNLTPTAAAAVAAADAADADADADDTDTGTDVGTDRQANADGGDWTWQRMRTLPRTGATSTGASTGAAVPGAVAAAMRHAPNGAVAASLGPLRIGPPSGTVPQVVSLPPEVQHALRTALPEELEALSRHLQRAFDAGAAARAAAGTVGGRARAGAGTGGGAGGGVLNAAAVIGQLVRAARATLPGGSSHLTGAHHAGYGNNNISSNSSSNGGHGAPLAAAAAAATAADAAGAPAATVAGVASGSGSSSGSAGVGASEADNNARIVAELADALRSRAAAAAAAARASSTGADAAPAAAAEAVAATAAAAAEEEEAEGGGVPESELDPPLPGFGHAAVTVPAAAGAAAAARTTAGGATAAAGAAFAAGGGNGQPGWPVPGAWPSRPVTHVPDSGAALPGVGMRLESGDILDESQLSGGGSSGGGGAAAATAAAAESAMWLAAQQAARVARAARPLTVTEDTDGTESGSGSGGDGDGRGGSDDGDCSDNDYLTSGDERLIRDGVLAGAGVESDGVVEVIELDVDSDGDIDAALDRLLAGAGRGARAGSGDDDDGGDGLISGLISGGGGVGGYGSDDTAAATETDADGRGSGDGDDDGGEFALEVSEHSESEVAAAVAESLSSIDQHGLNDPPAIFWAADITSLDQFERTSAATAAAAMAAAARASGPVAAAMSAVSGGAADKAGGRVSIRATAAEADKGTSGSEKAAVSIVDMPDSSGDKAAEKGADKAAAELAAEAAAGAASAPVPAPLSAPAPVPASAAAAEPKPEAAVADSEGEAEFGAFLSPLQARAHAQGLPVPGRDAVTGRPLVPQTQTPALAASPAQGSAAAAAAARAADAKTTAVAAVAAARSAVAAAVDAAVSSTPAASTDTATRANAGAEPGTGVIVRAAGPADALVGAVIAGTGALGAGASGVAHAALTATPFVYQSAAAARAGAGRVRLRAAVPVHRIRAGPESETETDADADALLAAAAAASAAADAGIPFQTAGTSATDAEAEAAAAAETAEEEEEEDGPEGLAPSSVDEVPVFAGLHVSLPSCAESFAALIRETNGYHDANADADSADAADIAGGGVLASPGVRAPPPDVLTRAAHAVLNASAAAPRWLVAVRALRKAERAAAAATAVLADPSQPRHAALATLLAAHRNARAAAAAAAGAAADAALPRPVSAAAEDATHAAATAAATTTAAATAVTSTPTATADGLVAAVTASGTVYRTGVLTLLPTLSLTAPALAAAGLGVRACARAELVLTRHIAWLAALTSPLAAAGAAAGAGTGAGVGQEQEHETLQSVLAAALAARASVGGLSAAAEADTAAAADARLRAADERAAALVLLAVSARDAVLADVAEAVARSVLRPVAGSGAEAAALRRAQLEERVRLDLNAALLAQLLAAVAETVERWHPRGGAAWAALTARAEDSAAATPGARRLSAVELALALAGDVAANVPCLNLSVVAAASVPLEAVPALRATAAADPLGGAVSGTGEPVFVWHRTPAVPVDRMLPRNLTELCSVVPPARNPAQRRLQAREEAETAAAAAGIAREAGAGAAAPPVHAAAAGAGELRGLPSDALTGNAPVDADLHRLMLANNKTFAEMLVSDECEVSAAREVLGALNDLDLICAFNYEERDIAIPKFSIMQYLKNVDPFSDADSNVAPPQGGRR
jgi:hypothetical protein